MMKKSFEGATDKDATSKGCSSSGCKHDQEMGANTNLKNGGEVPVDQNNKTINCFSHARGLNLARMVFAEMLGTFILMFSVCGIIASMKLIKGEVGLLEYASTGGFAIIVVIYSIGHISGAHVNPSVTIAFAALGKFPWHKVPLYVSAQTLGSVLAVYVGKSVYGIQVDSVVTQPLQRHDTAFWAELIATFFIMFLASALACDGQIICQLSGVVVGAAIALAILITGPISGGSMNPARSLGPAIVSWKFDNIWLYLVAPTIGAVASTLLYRSLRIHHPPRSSK